uniref:Uncharacterized protein n=1 Tax=Compsopogon caeruleus TaxID=31354 RepID=A0A7S1XCP7_9RHOD
MSIKVDLLRYLTRTNETDQPGFLWTEIKCFQQCHKTIQVGFLTTSSCQTLFLFRTSFPREDETIGFFKFIVSVISTVGIIISLIDATPIDFNYCVIFIDRYIWELLTILSFSIFPVIRPYQS